MIDPKKKYETRDGKWSVKRFLAIDAIGAFPIVVELVPTEERFNYRPFVALRTSAGEVSSVNKSPLDLVEVPEAFDFGTYWVNVYPPMHEQSVIVTSPYKNKESADLWAGVGRIACLPFQVKGTVGEGLGK